MKVSYCLSPTGPDITPDSDVWHLQLPLTRHLHMLPNDPDNGRSISYAEYFIAVRDFLTNDRLKMVLKAVGHVAGMPVTRGQIHGIRICLEKHGAFYHPARVEVQTENRQLLFVVNVAVSRSGLSTMDREHRLLKTHLGGAPPHFLPMIYGMNAVQTRIGKRLQMIMGEWFHGFYEFHLSVDPNDRRKKLMVWDPEKGSYFLTPAQSRDLYRQVAMILTFYYNPETFEQIFSWHHAAGDFIVKPIRKNAVNAKLITVRRYDPIFENVEQTPETILEALMVFFLNLSIRTRLDRLDGVGELAWSDRTAVPATLDGFVDGLALKVRNGEIPDGFIDYFKAYMTAYAEVDLYDMAGGILARYPENSPEISIVAGHLKGHVRELHHAILDANSRNPTGAVPLNKVRQW